MYYHITFNVSPVVENIWSYFYDITPNYLFIGHLLYYLSRNSALNNILQKIQLYKKIDIFICLSFIFCIKNVPITSSIMSLQTAQQSTISTHILSSHTTYNNNVSVYKVQIASIFNFSPVLSRASYEKCALLVLRCEDCLRRAEKMTLHIYGRCWQIMYRAKAIMLEEKCVDAAPTLWSK